MRTLYKIVIFCDDEDDDDDDDPVGVVLDIVADTINN